MDPRVGTRKENRRRGWEWKDGHRVPSQDNKANKLTEWSHHFPLRARRLNQLASKSVVVAPSSGPYVYCNELVAKLGLGLRTRAFPPWLETADQQSEMRWRQLSRDFRDCQGVVFSLVWNNGLPEIDYESLASLTHEKHRSHLPCWDQRRTSPVLILAFISKGAFLSYRSGTQPPLTDTHIQK